MVRAVEHVNRMCLWSKLRNEGFKGGGEGC